jgi:hypothetical protein
MIMAIKTETQNQVWANRTALFLFECCWGDHRFELCVSPNCNCIVVAVIKDGELTQESYQEVLKVVTDQSTMYHFSDKGKLYSYRGKALLTQHCVENDY